MSEPPSRARTPSPDPRQPRPSKRRKVTLKQPRFATFPDGNDIMWRCVQVAHISSAVVTKKIIPESEARELFRM